MYHILIYYETATPLKTFPLNICPQGSSVQIWRQFETIEMKLTLIAAEENNPTKCKKSLKDFDFFRFVSLKTE